MLIPSLKNYIYEIIWKKLETSLLNSCNQLNSRSRCSSTSLLVKTRTWHSTLACPSTCFIEKAQHWLIQLRKEELSGWTDSTGSCKGIREMSSRHTISLNANIKAEKQKNKLFCDIVHSAVHMQWLTLVINLCKFIAAGFSVSGLMSSQPVPAAMCENKISQIFVSLPQQNRRSAKDWGSKSRKLEWVSKKRIIKMCGLRSESVA